MADKSRPQRPAKPKAASSGLPVSSKKPTRNSPMSEPESSQGTVFEIGRIRRLVELMKEHDLSEVDLRESRQRIRICRGPKEASRPAPPPAAPPAGPAPAAAPAGAGPGADGTNIVVIKSPMVGTFYSRPNPKAEAYVKVGDRVDATTVVCIIEAMKVFNEIPAETRGQIVAVLVADGESVEFEKPLFKVDTSK
jgi:acetyl-CoA carboxylase biotin carboxyl carrier protein